MCSCLEPPPPPPTPPRFKIALYCHYITNILLYRLLYICSYVARTDPADVARVESKTFIVTKEKYTSVPHVQEGERGILGQWMGPEDATQKLGDRFPGCMTGNDFFF